MRFKVEAFEGPLDLLLHLINKLEIDIYDIPVAEITEQYMQFVQTMQTLELNIVSEYLVMAATLLAIKSKMLLPKQEMEVDIEEINPEDDPRLELVERLIEYKRYKEVASKLKNQEQERNFYFSKPPVDLSSYGLEAEVEKLNISLEEMLGAFNKLLRRRKLSKPLHTRIAAQEISIDEKMKSVMNKLNHSKGRLKFEELFEEHTKEQLVVTFLALLELIKRKQVNVEQSSSFGELYVESKGEKLV